MKVEKDSQEIIKISVLLIFLLAAGFGWFSPLRSKVDASGSYMNFCAGNTLCTTLLLRR